MTRRPDYTSDEWTLLQIAPELIGLRMVTASFGGPIGKLRAFTALSACLAPREAPSQFGRNELVAALLEDPRIPDGGPFAYLAHGDLSGLIVALTMARVRTLACCEHVALVLERRSTRPEAEGVKRWLLWVGRHVAQAPGDGWLRLSLGHKRRATTERMLKEIAAALRISPVEPVPTGAELEALLGLAPRDAGRVADNDTGRPRPASGDG